MSTPEMAVPAFTSAFVRFQGFGRNYPPMQTDAAIREALCDNFMAVCEASGKTKQEFAASVGLSGPQLTNISRYRNPPPHRAIEAVQRVYGITTDFLYTGNLGGMRDQAIADRIRSILADRTSPKPSVG